MGMPWKGAQIMAIKSTNLKQILCFEVDEITCENWMLAVKPDGSNRVLVLSPYFIMEIYNYAIKHKILKGQYDK